MVEASLTLHFLTFKEHLGDYLNEIIINDITYQIKPELGSLEIKIPFNKYEEDLGKKVCRYILLRNTNNKNDDIEQKNSDKNKIKEENINMVNKNKIDEEKNENNLNEGREEAEEEEEEEEDEGNAEKGFLGLFEIYLGNNIGYCFVDYKGNTFELLFLRRNNKNKKLLTNKFVIENTMYPKNIVEVTPNRIDTKDRANLLLINLPSNTIIKLNKNKKINIERMYKKIRGYNTISGFQICFHDFNLKDFFYRKVEETKQLNFDKTYNQYNETVNKIYNTVLEEIEKNNPQIETIFSSLYDKVKNNLEKSIIRRKFNYSKKILKEDLNEEYYIDFIFKQIFLMYIDYNINEKKDLTVCDIKNIYDKLIINKNKIKNDESLENYEKAILMIELFTSKILKNEDYIINYLNLKNIEKNSPLDYTFNFLNSFIEDLDYKSNFYYPFLSIDCGNFSYILKKGIKSEVITAFGFNMISLDKIKSHLKNMIPNVIVLSKFMQEDNKNDDAQTNIISGVTTLNTSELENKSIDKNELKESDSKHLGFIISRNLIHEFFGHKKSSYAEEGVNNYSIISFKDEFGEIKFLSNDINYLFKGKDEVNIGKVPLLEGESGYFIEYHLGKIYDEYITFIIDDIKKKAKLGVLLNSQIWHNKPEILKEYIELTYIMINLGIESKIDDTLDIDKQLDKMREITKNYKTESDNSCEKYKDDKDNNIIKNNNIQELFKKRKANLFSQRKNKNNQKINEEKRLNLEEYILKYGYYKK